MFERYTEKARRVIFFARYEAAELKQTEISSDGLLLGILKEVPQVVELWLAMSPDAVRAEVERRAGKGVHPAHVIDIPLAAEAKVALAKAAEEADALGHRHIGTEHLLIGIAQDKGSLAAHRLMDRKISVDDLRRGMKADGNETQKNTSVNVARAGTSEIAVELRGEDGSVVETLSMFPWKSASLPAIGHALQLSDGSLYRVIDVRWLLRRGGGTGPGTGLTPGVPPAPVSNLRRVELIVRKEPHTEEPCAE